MIGKLELDVLVNDECDKPTAGQITMTVRRVHGGVSIEVHNKLGQPLAVVTMDYFDNQLKVLVEKGWDVEPVTTELLNDVAAVMHTDQRGDR